MAIDDEFRYLSADAARAGRVTGLPHVERIRSRDRAGRLVSALAFDTSGTAANPVDTVFLHGAGLNAHGWDPTILALDVPALALDLPGHGHSDWRHDGNYSPAALSGSVLDALHDRTMAPVHLVGHSLGGLIAALIAAAEPERVSSLTLVDITPDVVTSEDAAAVREFLGGPEGFASHEEIVLRALHAGIGTDRPALERGVALNTRVRSDGRVVWAHHLAQLPAEAITATDPELLWTALRHVRAPLLLIAAADGFVRPPLLEAFQRRLPRAQTAILPGPHNLHEADPRGLAELLRRARGHAASPLP